MTRLRQPHSGFTLIEVMIAMLIGIIGIVVMMQTFAVSEGFKRTATSGTDAQVNGSVALYMLEREIRTAGYGMNGYLPAAGAAPTNTYCSTVRVWNAASGTGKDVRILPFEINPAGIPAGDANTDVIVVGYGNSDSVVAGVQAEQGSTGGAATSPINVLSSKDGFRNGDLIVSMQPGVGAAPASCVLHEITQTPGAAGSCGSPSAGSTLIHGTSGYQTADKSYAMCSVVTPRFNSGSGIKDSGGATVPILNQNTGGQVFNLGNPSLKAYAIRGGNLTSCDILQLDCTVLTNYTIIVNDIVSLRAIYGRDTTNPQDFTVDVWDRTPLPTLADAATVMAVMLEITARSGVKEKPSVPGGACDTLTDPTRPDKIQDWIGAVGAPGIATGIGIDLSLSAPTGAPATDWQCYRYRLYQTRVPIRNMSWRP
jgi:type IV pilus assembly protein PilW